MVITEANIDEIRDIYERSMTLNKRDDYLKYYRSLEDYYDARKDFANYNWVYLNLIYYLNAYGLDNLIIKYGLKYKAYCEIHKELHSFPAYYTISAAIDIAVGDYKSAKNATLRECELYLAMGNRKAVAESLGNLGEFDIENGDYNQALEYLLDAKETLIHLNLHNEIEGIYNKSVIAKVYMKLKNLPVAKRYLDDLIAWDKIDQMPNIRFELYSHYGDYYRLLGETERALMYYIEAEEIAFEAESGLGLERLYKTISETYLEVGNYELAFKYLDSHVQLVKKWKNSSKQLLRHNYELELMILNYEKELRQHRQEGIVYDVEQKYDALTGAYTKSFVMRQAERFRHHFLEEGSDFGILILSVLSLLELDKKMDMESHARIFKEIVDALTNVATPVEYIARLNSYKVIICLGETDDDTGSLSAKKFITALQSYRTDQGEGIYYAGGFASYGRAGVSNLEELIRLADSALYRSEQTGGQGLAIW